MCRAKEPPPISKGRDHTGSLNVKMQPFMSGLLFSYAWKDFKIIWHKCLPYRDNMSRDKTSPLSQRSRSHLLFQCLYAGFRVRAIIPLCVKGFPVLK